MTQGDLARELSCPAVISRTTAILRLMTALPPSLSPREETQGQSLESGPTAITMAVMIFIEHLLCARHCASALGVHFSVASPQALGERRLALLSR